MVSLPKVKAEAGFCEQFHENNAFTFINNRDYWQSVKQPGFLLDKKRYPGESQVYDKCNSLETGDKVVTPFEMYTIYPNVNLHLSVLDPTDPTKHLFVLLRSCAFSAGCQCSSGFLPVKTSFLK